MRIYFISWFNLYPFRWNESRTPSSGDGSGRSMTDHHRARPTTSPHTSYIQFILPPLPLPRLLTPPRQSLLHTAVVAINFCLTGLLGCIASFRPSDTGLIFEPDHTPRLGPRLDLPACLPASAHDTTPSHNHPLTAEKNSTRKGPEF